MVVGSSAIASIAALSLVAFTACGTRDPAGVDQQLSSIVPNIFDVNARPGSGCQSANHRQFDFWLGKWDVYVDTTLVGTNNVERELDGCIVEENWIDPAGGRGRSINVYDAVRGKWSQTWAFSGGGFGAFVHLEGGLVDGTMHVEGSRVTPTGLEFFNTINWTPLPGGRVRQFGELRQGTGPLQPNFDVEYRPVAVTTPMAEMPRVACMNRPQNRQFDFALGLWGLHSKPESKGREEGTSTFTIDLMGCLIEERLSGPQGYEAWSFNTWHTVTQKWHRTYVDNRGLVLVLSGSKVGDAIVMSGKHMKNRKDVHVRVSWMPDGEGMKQIWEESNDAGSTWKTASTVYYVKGS